jgi:hypothetical protein
MAKRLQRHCRRRLVAQRGLAWLPLSRDRNVAHMEERPLTCRTVGIAWEAELEPPSADTL